MSISPDVAVNREQGSYRLQWPDKYLSMVDRTRQIDRSGETIDSQLGNGIMISKSLRDAVCDGQANVNVDTNPTSNNPTYAIELPVDLFPITSQWRQFNKPEQEDVMPDDMWRSCCAVSYGADRLTEKLGEINALLNAELHREEKHGITRDLRVSGTTLSRYQASMMSGPNVSSKSANLPKVIQEHGIALNGLDVRVVTPQSVAMYEKMLDHELFYHEGRR